MPANDVDDRALLVHVGYHKTGTTWLQREVFANAALGFRVALGKEEVLRLLIEPRAVSFDAASCRDEVAAALDSQETRPQVPVLSSEELCGSPHSGAVLEKELADRLAATAPGARVLIVVREQRAMLASAYKQFVRAGGTLSLDTFLSPASLGDPRTGLPDWRHYRYDGLIRCYRERFGPDRVLVLPYELLRRTPATFVTRVVDFCRATASAAAIEQLPYANDVHPSLGALGTSWKRRVNRYIARTDRLNPEPWLRVTKRGHYTVYEAIRRFERAAPEALRRRADDHTREAIHIWAQHRFRESNSATDKWTEDDLSALGYATL